MTEKESEIKLRPNSKDWFALGYLNSVAGGAIGSHVAGLAAGASTTAIAALSVDKMRSFRRKEQNKYPEHK